MSRLTRALVGLLLLATLVVSVSPTASAMSCAFSPSPIGGIVGRTYDYATAVADAACDETIAYYSDVCVFAFGPQPVCYLR